MYLLDPETHDPSNDPRGNQVHPQTVEQFAYFLYAYPEMSQYISAEFYSNVLKFAVEQWEKVGLFDVITDIGTLKGRHCPGHSIMPNLMMHVVAQREGRPDADRYMEAALANRRNGS